MNIFLRIPKDDFKLRIKKKINEFWKTNKTLKNVESEMVLHKSERNAHRFLNPIAYGKGKNNRKKVLFLKDKEKKEIIEGGIDSLVKYVSNTKKRNVKLNRFYERIKLMKGFNPTPPLNREGVDLFKSNLFEIQIGENELKIIDKRLMSRKRNQFNKFPKKLISLIIRKITIPKKTQKQIKLERQEPIRKKIRKNRLKKLKNRGLGNKISLEELRQITKQIEELGGQDASKLAEIKRHIVSPTPFD